MKHLNKVIILIITLLSVFFIANKWFYISNNKIVVLYTHGDPVIPDVPNDCCIYQTLEDFVDKGIKANTVIFSGHGEPPIYALHKPKEISKIISSYEPELIVLNSCYSSSTPILEALTKTSSGAFVVASPFQIYLPGYVFGKNFFDFSLSPSERAKAVKIEPDYPILKWKLNENELNFAKAKVNSFSKKELKKRLRRRTPPLIRVPMPESLDKGSELLVMLSKDEIKKLLK